MSRTGGCNCGDRVLWILVADDLTAVDAQPHPSGLIEVKYYGPIPYGRKLAHGQPPRPGATRHRRHSCQKETP